MPKRRTGFDNDWLQDVRFSSWIAKSAISPIEAFCSICKKSFSVSNGGAYQVIQHMEGARHSNLAKVSAAQPRFEIVGGIMHMQSSTGLRTLSQEDKISRAEILFLLRLMKHNHSFASCDDLSLVLRAAFNDPVATGMILSATKASYATAFGLGPYFHDKVITDMRNAI